MINETCQFDDPDYNSFNELGQTYTLTSDDNSINSKIFLFIQFM